MDLSPQDVPITPTVEPSDLKPDGPPPGWPAGRFWPGHKLRGPGKRPLEKQRMVTLARKYATEIGFKLGEKDEDGKQLPQGPAEMLLYIAATGRNPWLIRQIQYAQKMGVELPPELSKIRVGGEEVEGRGFLSPAFCKECLVDVMPFLWPKLRSMEIKDDRENPNDGPISPELAKNPRFRALAEEVEKELAENVIDDTE